ncbi:MAG: hypothetical protein OHK0046_35600 [Anaerolineae bacterium]
MTRQTEPNSRVQHYCPYCGRRVTMSAETPPQYVQGLVDTLRRTAQVEWHCASCHKHIHQDDLMF